MFEKIHSVFEEEVVSLKSFLNKCGHYFADKSWNTFETVITLFYFI